MSSMYAWKVARFSLSKLGKGVPCQFQRSGTAVESVSSWLVKVDDNQPEWADNHKQARPLQTHADKVYHTWFVGRVFQLQNHAIKLDHHQSYRRWLPRSPCEIGLTDFSTLCQMLSLWMKHSSHLVTDQTEQRPHPLWQSLVSLWFEAI